MNIELRSITKKFGALCAVNSVSVSFQKNEVVALTGANGAGKSTLIRLIAQLLSPSAGELFINGRPIAETKERFLHSLGIVTGESYLYDDLTVIENLKFYGALVQRKTILDDVLSNWNLEDLKHRPIKELSRGQKQRVSLARASLSHPKILLLDEPFVGLDRRSIDYVRALIQSVAADGGLSIIATHTPDCLNDLMTRWVDMESGVIIRDDRNGEWQGGHS